MHLTKHVIGAPLLALLLIAAAPTPASADITAFLGVGRRASTSGTSQPGLSQPTYGRPVTGVAFGMGLLVLGFEVEGASHAEDTTRQIPGLKTGMANVLVQTPTGGAQLYATTGAGLFHESLGTVTDTNFATNIGGGLKLGLAGPLRLRVDYRLIHLHGQTSGTPTNIQRFYAGLNLKF